MYEDLPSELIYEICSKMDVSELSNLAQTSSRNRDICQDIIDNKIEDEINYIKKYSNQEQMALFIYDEKWGKIPNREIIYNKFFEIGPYSSIQVRMFFNPRGAIELVQYNMFKQVRNEIIIFPEIETTRSEPNFIQDKKYFYHDIKNDEENIRFLAKRLVEQGFKHI